MEINVPTTARGFLRATRDIGMVSVLAAAALTLGGCHVDSFLDPSVNGRWEQTPLKSPILRRIAAIEGPDQEFVEYSEVTAGDLVPEIETYRLGPGDLLDVVLFDLPSRGQTTQHQRLVDARGFIELPQLGEVYVSGKTLEEARQSVTDSMKRFVAVDPLATVVVLTPRGAEFTILGGVARPGRYPLPSADFRLLDAIALAGTLAENVNEVYVIRQIPLTDSASGRPAGGQGQGNGAEPAPTSEELLNLIDELGGDGGSQPEQPTNPAEAEPPPIDLIPNDGSAPPAGGLTPDDSTSWVFLNGRWVQVRRPARSGGSSDDVQIEDLITQRVIRIPIKPLLAGQLRYNLVIRPGDVVRVPPPPSGFVYLVGSINRPGSFSLPENLTLRRVVATAGGLSSIAIPERVDITRMLENDQQATIMVNLRAIEHGTQPDIYLKENDLINFGTNFWAAPLAVVRGGFRASYGFGFLLDRNFGNDVFGAPPTNRFDQ